MLTGPFVLLYVPGKLFVAGNATATASNILAHQSLFQTYIGGGFVLELLFILVVLALYRLLKGVGPQLAILTVILILLDAPLAFSSVANEVAALAFVRGTIAPRERRSRLVTALSPDCESTTEW